jgi:hypothetical protein
LGQEGRVNLNRLPDSTQLVFASPSLGYWLAGNILDGWQSQKFKAWDWHSKG